MHTRISSHGLKRSWHSCPRRVNAGNKNTPSSHHPGRRNVTTLMVGLKNGHIRKNLPQKWWTPEIYLGNAKKKKKKKVLATCNFLCAKRYEGKVQSLSLTELNIAFILALFNWLKPLTDEGGKESWEKTLGDEFWKMPYTKARNFKTQVRLRLVL